MCETVWIFSLANTHPFDLKCVALCPKFSGDSYVEFQEKNNFGRIFQKFCANQGYLYQKLWNFALLSETVFWVCIALKRFTRVLAYVICTQVRSHVHKQITKRRYGGEKPGRLVFGKPVLFTLGLGLTTPYSLGILVWNFYQTFVTVSIEFSLRFEPQIHPTKLAINFLLSLSWLKARFVLCEIVWFFCWRILIRLTWNLSRFVPNSVEILTCNFRKKLFRENFSEILCNPRLSFTKTSEIWPYFPKFYSGSVLRWKNSHEYLRMLFVPR